MTDIQAICSILLARNYQDQLFSSLPGEKKEKGKETLATCPFCGKEEKFSYSSQKPLWQCWHCGEGGDWIQYLAKSKGYDFQQSLAFLAQEAGVQLTGQSQANYQAYVKRADILETAQESFRDALLFHDKAVLEYLVDRGYTADDIQGMELGAYVDRQALQAELQKQNYTLQEIQETGLLTQGFGTDYQLTLLWRDKAGRAIGIVGRSLLEKDELKAKGLSKYKYSSGMEKSKGLIGFSTVRGSSQVVLVEGGLDALYLNHKGFRSVAVGGTSLSADQLSALETTGTRELLLAMDQDEPGQKATEKLIKSLATSSLRAYVVSWPAEDKDPDELVRHKGTQAFQDALDKAESWLRWIARRIVSKQDISTDRGLDQALEEAVEVYTDLEDKLSRRAFLDSLKASTGLEEEDLASRLEQATQRASVKRTEQIIQSSAREIQQKASQGDITGAELELTRLLREVKTSKGVEAPEPYTLEALTADLLATSPAMATGFSELDKTAGIPVGALTIIAGRPGHGKTTFQLNLLVNMLKAYPDKSFYFFSYEEARKAIALKLVMILAGVELNSSSNYGAYVNYLQEKRGTNKKIETAILEYEKLTNSGRLLLSDRMDPAEDLVSVISQLAKIRDTGAVIVDYIQKIPLLRPAQSQRYLDIKLVSAMLLEQAVTQDIPIILGAQLGRDKAQGSRPRLDNLRESGDIEQDANLVLGLYTEAVANMEEADDPFQALAKVSDPVDIQVSVLKNRGGIAGKSYTMEFNRPVLTIRDKTSGAKSSVY